MIDPAIERLVIALARADAASDFGRQVCDRPVHGNLATQEPLMSGPNARELKVLAALEAGPATRGDLPFIGATTLAGMVEKGWIEEEVEPDALGRRRWRITPLGEATGRKGPAKKPRSRARVKALPARLSPLPSRLKSPNGE